MSRADQVMVDRFAVANAMFWLDQVADWLDTDHADQITADLWPGDADTGPPLKVIVSRAAAALCEALSDQVLQ